MPPRTRPYQYYDIAVSICSRCYRRVDAKIVFSQGRVWMHKRCSRHGAESVLIADDVEYYKLCREVFVKEPEQVLRYNTEARYGCPYDCGICPDHEQHGCNLLLEITDACNLECPTCYADSGPKRQKFRRLEEIEAMLDCAVRNEGEPEIVQVSGGEPTLHPQFFEVLDRAKARPIRHLMVNTNGLRIANEPGFAERLKAYEPHFELYLQFDSFQRTALMTLRAADLRGVHARALERLNELNLSTTLVVTVRRGVNDDELGAIVDFAVSQPCVRGVTFQPVQAAGRLERYEDGFSPDRDRLTLTEVRRRLLRQTDAFEPEDIIPVPCHADSVAMAYALKRGGKLMPLTGMVDPEVLISAGRNTISYESDRGVRGRLFDLFSTRHSSATQATALQEFLRAAGGGEAPPLTKEDIFRVLIIQFMDAHSFDLRSIRKSCVHILHPDGQRAIPFDTYNLLYRGELEERVLAPLRAERSPGQRAGALPVLGRAVGLDSSGLDSSASPSSGGA